MKLSLLIALWGFPEIKRFFVGNGVPIPQSYNISCYVRPIIKLIWLMAYFPISRWGYVAFVGLGSQTEDHGGGGGVIRIWICYWLYYFVGMYPKFVWDHVWFCGFTWYWIAYMFIVIILSLLLCKMVTLGAKDNYRLQGVHTPQNLKTLLEHLRFAKLFWMQLCVCCQGNVDGRAYN